MSSKQRRVAVWGGLLVCLATTALRAAEETPQLSTEARRPAAGREELIKKFDKNGDGQLDAAERQAAMAERGANRPARSRPASKSGEVITQPDRSERWSNQLEVGVAAPDFTLPLLPASQLSATDTADPQGKTAVGSKTPTVSLRELRAKRPVVLVFGSITCPPFRGQLDGIDQVYEQFKDQAEFLFVYIREAHPDSVLSVVGSDGSQSLLKITQAANATTRTESATVCQRTLKLNLPIAVDSIDNAVGKAYAGWPNRMVVVGTDGKVIYASDPAPGGTNAQRLQAWLEGNLAKTGK